jgi:hypothetical protein
MSIKQKFRMPALWEGFERERGNWAEENQVGVQRANELVDRIQREGVPGLLGHTVEAIIATGRFDGAEVGFFHRLAELAARPL